MSEVAFRLDLIDGSVAFSERGKLAAHESKRMAYNAAIAELLAASAAKVKTFTVTTDDHLPSHRNFIKNLCRDRNFLQLWIANVSAALDAEIAKEKSSISPDRKRIDGLSKSRKKILGRKSVSDELIEELDSLAPFGVFCPLPQLLQTRSDDGGVETLGVEIGGKFYRASDNEEEIGILVLDLTPVERSTISANGKTVTEVSSWPSHSFDETKQYPELIVNHILDATGVDVNKAIQELSISWDASQPQTAQKTFQGNNCRVDVSNKGRDVSVENYSSLFNEAVGINVGAMVHAVESAFTDIENGEDLNIIFCGIAYDFCVKNRVLDTINFITPALAVLRLAKEQGLDTTAQQVVNAMSNIVIARINQGHANIKDRISAEELCTTLGVSFERDKGPKVQIIIPQDATISIAGQDEARVGIKAAAKAQGVKLVEPTMERLKDMMEGKQDMLEIAEGLLGREIDRDSDLGKALQKLPTIDELNKAKDSNETALAILNKFEKYYAASVKPTGIAEIDEARRSAFCLKFITQEMSERTSANKGRYFESSDSLGGFQAFELEDWRLVCQEVLGHKGNNISISGVIGKRPKGKFGALAGGLSDVIPDREFKAIIRALEDPSLNAEVRKGLVLSLQRADNVEKQSGQWVFLDASKAEDEQKIKTTTVARETIEEFGELVIAKYLYQKEQGDNPNLADLFQTTWRVENLSPQARAIFAEQQAALDRISQGVNFRMIRNAEGQLEYVNKESVKAYRKLYKEEVEPFFARILREAKEGTDIHRDVYEAVTAGSGCIVHDLTFPDSRLKSFENGGSIAISLDEELEQVNGKPRKPRVEISIPVSTSYHISPVARSAFANLVDGTLSLAEEIENLTKYCVEARGFEVIQDPARRAAYLLKKFSEGFAGYPHEGLEAVQLALSDCAAAGVDHKAIEAQLIELGVPLLDVSGRREFESGLYDQFAKLVSFEIRDLRNSDDVLRSPHKVASIMFGKYSSDLLPNIMPIVENFKNIKEWQDSRGFQEVKGSKESVVTSDPVAASVSMIFCKSVVMGELTPDTVFNTYESRLAEVKNYEAVAKVGLQEGSQELQSLTEEVRNVREKLEGALVFYSKSPRVSTALSENHRSILRKIEPEQQVGGNDSQLPKGKIVTLGAFRVATADLSQEVV